MAKRRRSIYERYSPQAQAAALLRTSPERRGLRALLLEAQSQKQADIDAARVSGRVNRAAIHAADPEIQKVYAAARSGLSAVTGDYSHPAAGIAQDFAQLGPAAGSIAEAARAESEAAQRRTTEAETAARVDLQNSGVRSAEGEGYAIRAAQDRFRGDTGKIVSQLTGLDREEGLFAATELGRLVDAARGRSVTRRGQDKSAASQRATQRQSERSSQRSAGIDPDTGKPIPGGKLDPAAQKRKARAKAKANKWASPDAQRGARKDFGSAKGSIQYLKDTEGLSRKEAAELVLRGREKLKLSSGRELPSIKPVTDEALVEAALDHVYAKHLSRATQRRLHKNGIRVSPLGVTTYGQYRRRTAKAAPRYKPPENSADPKYGAH